MSLEEKGQSYLKRTAGMVILFAVLGSIILLFATNYLNKVIADALPGGNSTQQSEK